MNELPTICLLEDYIVSHSSPKWVSIKVGVGVGVGVCQIKVGGMGVRAGVC